jgi:hypothetical protein
VYDSPAAGDGLGEGLGDGAGTAGDGDGGATGPGDGAAARVAAGTVGVGALPPTHPQAMMSTVATIKLWTVQRAFGRESFVIIVGGTVRVVGKPCNGFQDVWGQFVMPGAGILEG